MAFQPSSFQSSAFQATSAAVVPFVPFVRVAARSVTRPARKAVALRVLRGRR